MRMMTTAVTPGPEGFEHRKFECPKCGHTETRISPSDASQPLAAGWTVGEAARRCVESGATPAAVARADNDQE
jgi:hypothetical protein